METGSALCLRPSGWIGFGKIGTDKGRFFKFSLQREVPKTQIRAQKVGFGGLRSNRVARGKKLEVELFCLGQQSGALEEENAYTFADEALILKREAEKLNPLLSGRCIYLVGMMGSGKTTVAKILSQALDYTFSDCDRLIEQAVDATSVAQIFEEHGEDFFRDNESKVLKDTSTMRKLVIATGGGAVIRRINWKYMKKGITVWLDVPLEALARRIAAVGTASRPLLHEESGDAYTLAFNRLSALFEERGHAYEYADARVSLQDIATKQDVNTITPTAIAIEATIRMKQFLTTNRYVGHISRDTA